jgi:hypothetical protein
MHFRKTVLHLPRLILTHPLSQRGSVRHRHQGWRRNEREVCTAQMAVVRGFLRDWSIQPETVLHGWYIRGCCLRWMYLPGLVGFGRERDCDLQDLMTCRQTWQWDCWREKFRLLLWETLSIPAVMIERKWISLIVPRCKVCLLLIVYGTASRQSPLHHSNTFSSRPSH